MNEVTKLYENAEPNRDCNLYKHFTEYPMKHTHCEDCENFVYPPFTAEKQLELIKWLANYERFCCWKFKPTNEWVIYDDTYMVDGRDIANSDFEECLASWIICIWQDLTDAECKQIKEILE